MHSDEVPTVPYCPFREEAISQLGAPSLECRSYFDLLALVHALIIAYEDCPVTLRAVPWSLIR